MKPRVLPQILAFFTSITFYAGAAPEKQPPLELPVPPAMLKESRQSARGIYMNGEKTGWDVSSREPGRIDGRDCIVRSEQLNVQIKALNDISRSDTQFLECFDVVPPHRALKMELIEKQDGQERRVALRLKQDTTYAVEITEGGERRSPQDVTVDYRLTHFLSRELWAMDPQRKPGDKAGWADFDFDTLERTVDAATIIKAAEWTGPDGKVPVWEIETYDFEMELASPELVSRTNGDMVHATIGDTMELRLEPEAVAKQKPENKKDLFLAATIKTDRKLGAAEDLTEVELELRGAAGVKALDLPETANQNVVRRADGTLTLKLSRGKGKAQPASDADRAENLKPTLRFPSDQEEIKKLAAEAVGTAANDRQKVRNLLRFTDRYLLDSGDVEALSVMDLTKTRRGDCSAHALLFTTLARAAGIPAREAGGWYYMGDEFKAFGGHAWNEVVLDGHWVPVDPIAQQIQLDAGHIQSHIKEGKGTTPGLSDGLRAKIMSSAKE